MVERRDEYLKQIDGLPIGPSESQGIVRGRHFYHGPQGFTMAFPEDWKIANQTRQLVAQDPGGENEIRVFLLERLLQQSACDFIRRDFEHRQPLRTFATSGYPACQGRIAVGNRYADMVVVEQAANALVVLVVRLTRAGRLRYRTAIQESIHSIREITAAEQAEARAPRLKIIQAKPGDTYASYTAPVKGAPEVENLLRLYNGAYPGGEPVAGESVKTIEP